jgi:sodium/hydrogen exchanger 3
MSEDASSASTGTTDVDTELAKASARDWYEQDQFVFLGVFVMMFVVMLLLLLGFAIEKTRTRFVPLTGFALMLGSFLGLALRGLSESDSDFRKVLIFNEDFFFVMLLPPIIFYSGYSMKRGNFFQNSGLIGLLAWAGTLFSALVVGSIVYAASSAVGAANHLSFVESLIFGALISATDPVSVLAVFRNLGVDRNLNAVVFGESVINDAVAIVMVRTLVPFLGDAQFGAGSLFEALGTFLLVFAGSVALGVCFGLGSALLFKHTRLYEHPMIETSVLVLLAYQSYMLAEGIHLSGIVAILFTAVTDAHFTWNNLSRKAQVLSKDFFHLLSEVSELFIFAYLGLALFSIEHIYDARLIMVTLASILAARAVHVAVVIGGVNAYRRRRVARAQAAGAGAKLGPVPLAHAAVIWFAGLRGAIAFALAMSLDTFNADVILSTTLIIVLITVLVFGTATEPVLRWLGVETGLSKGWRDFYFYFLLYFVLFCSGLFLVGFRELWELCSYLSF